MFPKLTLSLKLLSWFWVFAMLPNWRSAAQETAIDYVLLPDSQLFSDPNFPETIAGHFRLRALPGPGLISNYAVEDFTYFVGTGVKYTGYGSGSYQQDRNSPFAQHMSLSLALTYYDIVTYGTFTNKLTASPLPLPNLQLQVTELPAPFSFGLTLNLHAEPVMEIPFRILRADTGGVVLAWPAIFGSGTLLHATHLRPSDWKEMQPDLVQVGDELQATLPATDASGFFWLHTTTN
ncbi:MAG TPA: hypothetical protein VMB21_09955 [Candidatus Limnocylindria bacterium]|jgi:hypothetical protein|nr:hypothetical protein [Candidatus Limnocylindria bacterium]